MVETDMEQRTVIFKTAICVFVNFSSKLFEILGEKVAKY